MTAGIDRIALPAEASTAREGRRLRGRGVFQGVGFRPFVYNRALALGLQGWVRNTSGGVEIEVSGTDPALQAFVESLQRDAPPLARVERVEIEACDPGAAPGFPILPSHAAAGEFPLVPPDVATCPDCLRGLFDPSDRRHPSPFTHR